MRIQDRPPLTFNRPVRRVGLVGDFLRFEIDGDRCSNFQPRNLAWLEQMLRPALQSLTPQVKVKTLLAPTSVDAMARACGNRTVFEAYREDASAAWASLYVSEEPIAFRSLFNRMLDVDLVVGFELPPVVKHFLTAAGKPYLNLFVHPLRFLRDLCLGATTNSPDILRCLEGCVVPPHEVSHQAARFQAYFRRRQLDRLAIPPDLPVLIGQTEKDSVLITPEGRFDTWGAHAEALCDALRDTDAVVFLEHPMRPSSAIAVQEIRAATGKTVISTNANGYGLLMSNPRIPFVMTLASSLGVEAQALGLEARFLLSTPQDKLLEPTIEATVRAPLGHGLWQGRFWRELLRGITREDVCEPWDQFGLGEGYVRGSLESWAFRGLQAGLEGHNVRKTICWSADMPEARQDEVLAGLLAYTPVNRCPPGEAVQKAGPLGVTLDFVPPPVTIGTRQEIRLDQPAGGDFMFLSGFHAAEPWGRWTSDLRSELLVPVAPQSVQAGASLEVSLQLRLFGGLAHACPVLKMSSDGEDLGFIFFRPGLLQQACTLSIRATAPLMRLRLDLSHIDSPAAQGTATDSRWLGIALEGLTVCCTALSAAAASELASPRMWGLFESSVSSDDW